MEIKKSSPAQSISFLVRPGTGSSTGTDLSNISDDGMPRSVSDFFSSPFSVGDMRSSPTSIPEINSILDSEDTLSRNTVIEHFMQSSKSTAQLQFEAEVEKTQAYFDSLRTNFNTHIDHLRNEFASNPTIALRVALDKAVSEKWFFDHLTVLEFGLGYNTQTGKREILNTVDFELLKWKGVPSFVGPNVLAAFIAAGGEDTRQSIVDPFKNSMIHSSVSQRGDFVQNVHNTMLNEMALHQLDFFPGDTEATLDYVTAFQIFDHAKSHKSTSFAAASKPAVDAFEFAFGHFRAAAYEYTWLQRYSNRKELVKAVQQHATDRQIAKVIALNSVDREELTVVEFNHILKLVQKNVSYLHGSLLDQFAKMYMHRGQMTYEAMRQILENAHKKSLEYKHELDAKLLHDLTESVKESLKKNKNLFQKVSDDEATAAVMAFMVTAEGRAQNDRDNAQVKSQVKNVFDILVELQTKFSTLSIQTGTLKLHDSLHSFMKESQKSEMFVKLSELSHKLNSKYSKRIGAALEVQPQWSHKLLKEKYGSGTVITIW